MLLMRSVLIAGTLLSISAVAWHASPYRNSDEPDAMTAPAGAQGANRYIGAAACKNCHSGKEKGEQFEKWSAGPHAKAFEVLASPKAKEIAAKLKIDDPQKSPQCLKCHVTAHGVDKKLIKRGFKQELGIQCESCHGPGETHFKARFAAATSGKQDPTKLATLKPGEIISDTPVATCLECHNEKSPTFKPFCFKARNQTILHLDPRKQRTKEELEAMKCDCGEDCKCTQAECSKKPEGADKEKKGDGKEGKGDK